MKTFLLFVICLLVVDNGVPVLAEIPADLEGIFAPLPARNNWIILMQRYNGLLDFNRSWIEYKNGFGDIGRGEFWLGNQIVHQLTSRIGITFTLHVEVYISDQWLYADYANFSLDSEDNKYALHLSGFSGGNAGDSLTNTSVRFNWFHGGMSFTTWNSDNDMSTSSNCALDYSAGWWFNDCWFSCLTCPIGNYFTWYSLSNFPSGGAVGRARMMIKRV